MRSQLRFLESLATKYFVATIVVAILLTVATFLAVTYSDSVTLDQLAKFTDAVFKAVALLVGTIWALNRYFVQRTDVPQLRVDSDVDMIRTDESELSLLVFRLDLVNTGNTMIAPFQQFIAIDSVVPTADGTRLDTIYRWPESGSHPGGPIEPSSWSAVNSEVSCPASVDAVRIFIAVDMSQSHQWTWHKTFNVSKEKTNG